MKWIYSAAAAVALASPSTFAAPAAPLAPSYQDEAIVVTSATKLAAGCWEAIKGKPDAYALKAADPACLDAMKLEKAKAVAVDADGVFTIDGAKPKVKRALGPAGWLDPPAKAASDQGPFVLVLDGDKLVRVEAVEKAKPAAPPALFAECDWTRHGGGDLAIDLVHRSVFRAPPRNVVRPNRGLIVHVCRDPEKDVTAQWAGTRGLTRSEIAGRAEAEGAPPERKVERRPVRISTLTFPPRQAGAADLKLFEGADTTKPAMEVQLEIEPLYWGAVRFGLGTLWGDWRSYEVGALSGSRTQEVRETRDALTFELVSGFAPYVFDLQWGGRSQSGGRNAYVAPFLGFGVLGVSPDQGLQGLSSFHGGLELEVASNFSIAATFVYRRTRRLVAGYEIGSPVAAGMSADDLTSDAWVPGFAIVINATPAFLQFATGKSSPAASGGAQ